MPDQLQPDLDLETTSLSLDCNGDEDRGPGDDPDTDDAYIKVRRDGGDRSRSWTWTGDPMDEIYGTAEAAKAAAARYYAGFTLKWWEEEPDYWMAERPGWRMTEAWAGPPDDCDDGDPGPDATIERWIWTREAGQRAHLSHNGLTRCGSPTLGDPDSDRANRCGPCTRLAAGDLLATLGTVETLTIWRLHMDPRPADDCKICEANGYRPAPRQRVIPNLYIGSGESRHTILYPDGSGSIWRGSKPTEADAQIANIQCPLGARGDIVEIEGHAYTIHRILVEHGPHGWDWRVILIEKPDA